MFEDKMLEICSSSLCAFLNILSILFAPCMSWSHSKYFPSAIFYLVYDSLLREEKKCLVILPVNSKEFLTAFHIRNATFELDELFGGSWSARAVLLIST